VEWVVNMTDKAKLESLLTALRAAPGPSGELILEAARIATNDPAFVHKLAEMVTAGCHLAAAAAFREQMLPGWDYCVERVGDKYEANVGPRLSCTIYTERCATECLSIVAAVVAGVIAKESGK
jgi:hypothetical protein